MAAKKKGGGGKLSRSEVVTVRLDPKLRFAAELAARKQRRTLSSFIEWAIEEAVNRTEVTDSENVNYVMAQVWDVEEADRFVKLALNFPELLTFDEERLWRGSSSIDETSIDYPMLRLYWKTLQMIIAGEATEEDLEPLE
jgi:predicted transcriptional regulator